MSERRSDIYESMSSYELLELVYAASSASTELIAVFISILSAFFIAAYYFGNKLSGTELILLSAVYSAFSLVTMIGIYSQISGIMAIMHQLSGSDRTNYLNIYVGVMLVSWILSLLFMLKRWRLR